MGQVPDPVAREGDDASLARVVLRGHQVGPGRVVVERVRRHRAEIEDAEQQQADRRRDQRKAAQRDLKRDPPRRAPATEEGRRADRQQQPGENDRQRGPQEMQEPRDVDAEDEDDDAGGIADGETFERRPFVSGSTRVASRYPTLAHAAARTACHSQIAASCNDSQDRSGCRVPTHHARNSAAPTPSAPMTHACVPRGARASNRSSAVAALLGGLSGGGIGSQDTLPPR